MKDLFEHCHGLTEDELEKAMKFLAEKERRNLASLLAHLAEFDARRASDKKGHPSLFSYCVKVLRYDEGGAYRRIHAARVLRRYPKILPLLESGELNLTSLLLLSPILTEENHQALFEEAKGRSKREIETLVVAHDPRPPLPDHIRHLPSPPPWAPAPVPSGAAAEGVPMAATEPVPAEFVGIIPARAPHEWQAIVPISLERIRIGFDAGAFLMRLIDRARQVLRHKYPEGRLEDIVKDALEMLLDKKDPQRALGLRPPSADKPRLEGLPERNRILADGRYVSRSVQREVWDRDQGRCAWRFEDGSLCGSKDWLEFDHIRPFSKGGKSSAHNLRLLCRNHNRLAAAAAALLPAYSGVSLTGGPAAPNPPEPGPRPA